MKKIEFGEGNMSKMVYGMYSPELEYVEFSGLVNCEGNVEFWLTKIEQMMTQSLYDKTKYAINEYPEDGISRTDWLMHSNSQTILTVDMVMWTKGVEEAIYEIMRGKNSQALKEF
jgi:hypothetical protein